jgi:hypothetical protein
MCLAILKLPNSNIPEDFLYNGFMSNSHGAGFAVARGDTLDIQKGFFRFDDFLDAYNESIKDENAALIHFRLATHGTMDEANCHPFRINDDYAMIHNGIIPRFGNRIKSDTREYTDLILTPLFSKMDMKKVKFLTKKGQKVTGFNLAMLYTVLQTSQGNKIAILGRKGDFLICGEKSGVWINNVWYSNHCMIGHRRRFGSFSFTQDDESQGDNHDNKDVDAQTEAEADAQVDATADATDTDTEIDASEVDAAPVRL